MPVHTVMRGGEVVGYRWGQHGKLYRTRKKAELQAAAIFASGYHEDAGVRRARREVAQGLRPNRAAELAFRKHCVAVMRGVQAGILELVDRDILPDLERRHDAPGDNRDGVPDRAKRILTPRLREKVAGHIRKRVAPFIQTVARGVDKKSRRTSKLIGIPVTSAATINAESRLAEFQENGIRLLEDAGRDYTDDVREVLTAPENRGLRIEELKDQIYAKGKTSLARAALIATDQTLKLSSALNQARQTAAGVTTYRWSTSRDERVRGDPAGLYPKADPSHYALEGQVFRWDDPPLADVDGGPAHPGEAINCRCVAIPIIEGLDLGDDEVEDNVDDQAAEE